MISARRHYARFFRKKGAKFFIDAARGGLWVGAMVWAVFALNGHPAFAALLIAGWWLSRSLTESAAILAKAMQGKQGNQFRTEKIVVEAGDVADIMRVAAASASIAKALRDGMEPRT